MTVLRATLSTASPRALPIERLQDLALLQLFVLVLALAALALHG